MKDTNKQNVSIIGIYPPVKSNIFSLITREADSTSATNSWKTFITNLR